MNTVLVDNWDVREVFKEMLGAPLQQQNPLRVICISARSGKGKSTIIDYFIERCQEHAALPIRFDFDAFKVSSVLDFMDMMIDQFSTFGESEMNFSNYRTAIKSLALAPVGNTVIQDANFIQTNIGTIHVHKEDSERRAQLSFLDDAFYRDIINITKTSRRKIVFFLDALECASESLRDWINNKLVLSKTLGSQILFVLAGQINFEFNLKTEQAYGIKNFILPDAYKIGDWYEYGQQLRIADTETIRKCFNCWNGDPFYMCVALKPFANQG